MATDAQFRANPADTQKSNTSPSRPVHYTIQRTDEPNARPQKPY